jgi:hypothetical protein
VLILRELEEMGYREIAMVADVPIGTVMSRLARGRRKLAALLMAKQGAGLPASGLPASGLPGGGGAPRATMPGAGTTPTASVTPLRAASNGRPSNNPGASAAGLTQETPDGL